MDNYGVEVKDNLETLDDRINENKTELTTQLEKFESYFEDIQRRLVALEKASAEKDIAIIKNRENCHILRERLEAISNKLEKGAFASDTSVDKGKDYKEIDYFEFENQFRGSREEIKQRFQIYLPYLEGKKTALDLGCGRGEFLEVARENGILAKGVDILGDFVEYCNNCGLHVEHGDIIRFLEKAEQVDVIFAGQVIEHLEVEYILNMCKLVYERLVDGGVFILETPNPTTLAIYTNAFYIDPSHKKPVHPMFIQYCLSKIGFSKIEIRFPESTRPDCRVPLLKGDGILNLNEFNESIQVLNDLLYGSQDYIIIATKVNVS